MKRGCTAENTPANFPGPAVFVAQSQAVITLAPSSARRRQSWPQRRLQGPRRGAGVSVPRDCSHAAQPGLESSGRTSHHRWTGPCPGLACARAATLRAQMLQGAQKFFGAGEGLGGDKEVQARGPKERNKAATCGYRDGGSAQPGSRPRETPVPSGLRPPHGRAHWQAPEAQPDETSGKWTETLKTPGPAWASLGPPPARNPKQGPRGQRW